MSLAKYLLTFSSKLQRYDCSQPQMRLTQWNVTCYELFVSRYLSRKRPIWLKFSWNGRLRWLRWHRIWKIKQYLLALKSDLNLTLSTMNISELFLESGYTRKVITLQSYPKLRATCFNRIFSHLQNYTEINF